MSDHYIIIADRGHLRIFTSGQEPEQMSASLKEIQALDFPDGTSSYTHRDTDMAGRFQGSKHQGSAPGAPTARQGMSIDERLPMQREEERRRIQNVATTIDAFVKSHPKASWELAVAPAIHQAVVDELSHESLGRLRRVLAKDLVHQPVSELLTHFNSA